MAKIKVGSLVFAVSDIKVWPTDEDDLTTSRGWEVYMNWLHKHATPRKKCPVDKNNLWYPTEKEVIDEFEFDLEKAIPWGINPSRYLFIRFIEIGKPNEDYIGFIVSREHIVTETPREEKLIKYVEKS